ncbi:MAG TPA: ABC transporter transmembrane domain-containing protein, partial [Blastocatellia bacterium]|nr:ABC transporter transmembrane domain-containing protein [Blastocatellia bacterium]
MNDQIKFESGSAWLIFYFKKYRRKLILGTVCVLISVSFGVFIPNFVGRAIDNLKLGGLTYDKLLQSVLIIIGTSVISGIFLFLQRRILINMSRRIEYDLRQDFYGHLQNLPLTFFQNQRTGDLMS